DRMLAPAITPRGDDDVVALVEVGFLRRRGDGVGLEQHHPQHQRDQQGIDDGLDDLDRLVDGPALGGRRALGVCGHGIGRISWAGPGAASSAQLDVGLGASKAGRAQPTGRAKRLVRRPRIRRSPSGPSGLQENSTSTALPTRFSSGTKPTPGSAGRYWVTDASQPQVAGPDAPAGMTGSKRLSSELSRLSPIMK